MKASLHQKAAVLWTVSSTIWLAPLVSSSPKPSAEQLAWIGIATVTVMIATVDLLMKWAKFRMVFCWTDILSVSEMSLLVDRRIRDFYREAYNNRYLLRLKPYFFRVALLEFFLLVLPDLFSLGLESDVVRVMFIFSSFYPLGVLFLMVVTIPWAHVLREDLRRK